MANATPTDRTWQYRWQRTVNMWLDRAFWMGGWYFRVLGFVFFMSQVYRHLSLRKALEAEKLAEHVADYVLRWWF